MTIKTLAAAACLLLAAASSSQAATLSATGATGVDVGGTLYNVTFVDGTCVSVFDGCDDVSDFEFSSESEASAASAAFLLLFDSSFFAIPNVTGGCSNPNTCLLYTPYATSGSAVDFSYAYFRRGSSASILGSASGLPILADSTPASYYTWAVWAPAVTPVPLPAGGLLLLSSLAGIAALKRRKKRAA